MIRRPPITSLNVEFADLMRTLGETFAVRDVMVPLSGIEYVRPGDEDRARWFVEAKRYSAVPVSSDGRTFGDVFCTVHTAKNDRVITTNRATSVSDYIPDSTALAEAFFLFEEREWYLTLRGNTVSGLITYWAFNSRQFRVQLYAGFSRVEELSRDVLAKDHCGVSDDQGMNLMPQVLKKVRKQFERATREMGGNRFVDELQFSEVYGALKQHPRWREFLHQKLGGDLSDDEYDQRYNLTRLRNKVMHGKVLFPTYRDFRQFTDLVDSIAGFIGLLEDYIAPAMES
jgi:hypothetical protein